MLTFIGPSKYIKTGSIFVISSRNMGLKWPSSRINELGVFTRLENFFSADKVYWRLRTNVFRHNYNRCSCIVPPGPHRDFRVELNA